MVAASAIPSHPLEIAPRASDQTRIYAFQSGFSRVPGDNPNEDCALTNVLAHEKQIEVIAALCEGVGIRTTARLTGVNRGTVASLALRVGMGCMELHDRIVVGLRTERLELNELWSFVGKSKRTAAPRDPRQGRSVRFHRYGRDAEGNH